MGLITLLAPLTTAMASLVLQDEIPNPQVHRGTTGPRVLLFVGSLLVLVLVVQWRDYLATRRGTLFYVRLLDGYMHDWHRSAHDRAARDMLSQRVLSRWVTMAAEGGVIDVREAVGTACRDLQQGFNDDDTRTGYHLAPNMLWPLAFGFGYDLMTAPGTTLIDFGSPSGGASTGKFEWALDDLGRPTPDNFQSLETRDECGPGASGAVYVQATLTDKPALTAPEYRIVNSIRVGIFGNGSPVAVSVGTDHGAGDTHPVSAVQEWVTAIRRALHEHPGHVVLLTAKVPKTVALAGGYLLANPGGGVHDPGCGTTNCQNESCRYPWRFLVPLHYDIGEEHWQPVWVRPGQTDPRTLLDRLTAPTR